MAVSIATPFIALVALTFNDGSAVTAEGEAYTTYDACMVQAEHDARLMFNEAILVESRGGYKGRHLEGIVYDCKPLPANYTPHTGWLPEGE